MHCEILSLNITRWSESWSWGRTSVRFNSSGFARCLLAASEGACLAVRPATLKRGPSLLPFRNGERWEEKGVSTEERLNWWYSDEELSEWLPGVRQLAAEAEEVYLAFNTKAEDQSVVNAARLQRLLEREG